MITRPSSSEISKSYWTIGRLERAPAEVQEENNFIKEHGFREGGKWHLGIDDAEDATNKTHYKFPYGYFVRVHRCAVAGAESPRASQYKYLYIERAAAHLHAMLEALGKVSRRRTDQER